MKLLYLFLAILLAIEEPVISALVRTVGCCLDTARQTPHPSMHG
ncbi:defensin, beta 119, isoform CRA_d [Homo sapiens]|uniref:Defensin beta 119 n=2 Tax=Hominoidea TaxID=314295 RepID=A0A2I3GJS0_NOMLE|nr:beta-defensin 119 isoform b [Homo sapiens]EAW76451.1 defensin, beta 119, isoform CRA_d [Homo sapiens]